MMDKTVNLLSDEHLYDAFVSFASADRLEAERLVAALTACGLRIWFSFANLSDGSTYAADIVRAIGASRTLVILVTDASVASTHVEREVAEAARVSRRILPVYLDGSVRLSAQLRYYLGPLHRLKLDANETVEAAAQRIADGIRDPQSWLAESSPPASTPRERLNPASSTSVASS